LNHDERAELERLRAEVPALRAKNKETSARLATAHETIETMKLGREVEAVARTMGFEYPDIAHQLIDRGALTVDPETGETQGIRAALQALLKDRPGLQTAPPRGGTPVRETGGAQPAAADAPGTRALTPTEDLLLQGGYH